jgi:hypothetical protein
MALKTVYDTQNYWGSGLYPSPESLKRENTKTKQTPWPLVRERTLPTERPPLVDEI